ncbi:MAG TPA: YncE family protein, partial [Chloroflexota bacterium]
MTLAFTANVALPPDSGGGFDHGDVHLPSGRVFVAHTGNGTVDVIDRPGLRLERTLKGCAEGSGVLCGSNATEFVFAAARGDGHLVVFDPNTCEQLGRFAVGPRPNGLAWDGARRQLLVADVETFDARLMGPHSGACRVIRALPGRPRWCVYDAPRQRFLVNIREPACLVALAADTLEEAARVDGLPAGPHGLDLDRAGQRAFVACDAGFVCVVDLTTDCEIGRVQIAGEPDAVWYSPKAHALYVAIGNPGVVEVLDSDALAVAQQVETENGAHTTAFDARRQLLYVFVPVSARAMVFDEVSSARV